MLASELSPFSAHVLIEFVGGCAAQCTPVWLQALEDGSCMLARRIAGGRINIISQAATSDADLLCSLASLHRSQHAEDGAALTAIALPVSHEQLEAWLHSKGRAFEMPHSCNMANLFAGLHVRCQNDFHMQHICHMPAMYMRTFYFVLQA